MFEDKETNYLFYNANWKKDTEEFNRKSSNMEECRYYCSCGHSVIIPYWQDEKICSWCKHKVRKDDKRYFRDKMRQIMNEERRGKYGKTNNKKNNGR